MPKDEHLLVYNQSFSNSKYIAYFHKEQTPHFVSSSQNELNLNKTKKMYSELSRYESESGFDRLSSQLEAASLDFHPFSYVLSWFCKSLNSEK